MRRANTPPGRALSSVLSPASAQRRRDEMDAALARMAATRSAAPLGDGPRRPLSGPRAAEPAPAGSPPALGGLALLTAVVGARRRRRSGNAAAERNPTTPDGRPESEDYEATTKTRSGAGTAPPAP